MTALNVVVYAVVLVLAVTAYLKGGERHILGVIEAIKMILLVLPTLIGAFLIAGYIRVLMPEDVVREWLGEDSGLKGVLIGYLAGTLTFGGPFISFSHCSIALPCGRGCWNRHNVHNLMGSVGWRNHLLRVLNFGP